MCCHPCSFLIIGCRTNTKSIDTPEGYPGPPKRILCPYCGTIADTEYKRHEYTCHLCFIPCLPWGNSDPFLSCVTCKRDLGTVGDYRCDNCKVGTTFKSKNCPNCGASKGCDPPDSGYRRLDLK